MASLWSTFFVGAMLLYGPAIQAQTVLSRKSMQRLRAELPGMTDKCAAKITVGGLEAFPERVDQCFKMMPRRRWHGLWWQGFEHSRFCPAPAKTCDQNSSGDAIWLNFNDEKTLPKVATVSGLFAVDFEGRRTVFHGTYGHLGGSSQEIVVDKLIAVKRLRTDPR